MWDICLTYGVDNGRHVGRVLESVFKLQPQYERDTAAALSFVKEVFALVLTYIIYIKTNSIKCIRSRVYVRGVVLLAIQKREPLK